MFLESSILFCLSSSLAEGKRKALDSLLASQCVFLRSKPASIQPWKLVISTALTAVSSSDFMGWVQLPVFHGRCLNKLCKLVKRMKKEAFPCRNLRRKSKNTTNFLPSQKKSHKCDFPFCSFSFLICWNFARVLVYLFTFSLNFFAVYFNKLKREGYELQISHASKKKLTALCAVCLVQKECDTFMLFSAI